MRTLSDALKAAQRSRSSLPYPKVEVFDRVGGITRLDWARLYQGSEPDCFHAACMPSDGSLLRLRVNPGDNKLHRQRVTSPGESSDFSTWIDWGVDAYAVALAAYGTSVWAFRIDATDGHLYRCDSTDSGASWGSWTDMGDVSGDGTFRLAACAKNATEAVVLYSNGVTLYRSRLSGGSWESFAAWSNSLLSISGIACTYMGDWNIVVTGEEASTGRPGVWTCVLGDGYSAAPGSWTALKEMIPPFDADSGMDCTSSTLAYPDVFRHFYVEALDGSEPYSRPYSSHSPSGADYIDNLWREPVTFNLSSIYGLALCSSSIHAWLCRPDGVWRATLSPASCDLTADVLGMHTDIGETSGEIAIVLRNDDGRYANRGSGDYAAIKQGSELRFSPGYRTEDGIETSSGSAFWLSGWDYISRGGHAVFVLHASDGWSLPEAWRPRRELSWAAGDKNIFQLLSYIFSRAGLEFSSLSSSSTVTDLKPAFSIPAGQTGKRAVLRLLAMVPDVVFMRGHHAYLVNPQPGDSTDYEYGTGHPILEGHYRRRVRPVNRVQVQGADVATEDFEWAEVELVGDLLSRVYDVSIDTAGRAHDRGEAVLRGLDIHSRRDSVAVPLNCGQEIYDVVEITDARAGLDAVKRRVLGLQHMYDSRKGVYSLKLALGEV